MLLIIVIIYKDYHIVLNILTLFIYFIWNSVVDSNKSI
jgi:hypothetical protein